MSMENAQAFILLVRGDKGLQERVNGFKGAGALAQLVELGAELGRPFSIEEYREAVVAEAKGELDEEVLRDLVNEMGLAQQAPPDYR